jgi:F-type H+-transporting ATPase subunit a
MTAATLVTLALGLALGQQPAADAPAGHEAAPAEHGAAAEGHGGGHGGHGGGGLSGALMHHVTDGYAIEYPGVCADEEGQVGFQWGCEWNLRRTFGQSLMFGGQQPACAAGDEACLEEAHGAAALDMTPTKHTVMMWLASLVLVAVFALSVGKRSLVPSGLYNFLEMLVQFVRNEIAVKNIGERDADRFVPYLVSAFFFILFVNLFGLLPFAATATGNLSVTLLLALCTFVVTQYAAIRAMGLGGWLHHLTGGVHWGLWIIMIPVEILGLFTKPFALTVRLFANMIAGHIVILSLIGLIFALGSKWVALGSVPMALAIFALELFVGFVQAYIFTMLSSLFIGAGLVHHGHDEEHGEHGHGHEHGPEAAH